MASPRSNLAADLNKLITPELLKKSGGLVERAPREPIGGRQGSSRQQVAEASGTSGGIDGNFITTDGLFTLVIAADG